MTSLNLGHRCSALIQRDAAVAVSVQITEQVHDLVVRHTCDGTYSLSKTLLKLFQITKVSPMILSGRHRCTTWLLGILEQSYQGSCWHCMSWPRLWNIYSDTTVHVNIKRLKHYKHTRGVLAIRWVKTSASGDHYCGNGSHMCQGQVNHSRP